MSTVFFCFYGFEKQKDTPKDVFLFLLLCQLSLFNVENLLAIVEAANLAYAVGLEHLGASGVRALYKSGHCELGIVASSLISARFGHFSLRYCHIKTSSRSQLLPRPIININYFSFL